MKPIAFELGLLQIKTKEYSAKLMCDEFSFSMANENTVRYACDIVAPIDIAPTKKKFNFTIKKPKFFETDHMFISALYSFEFDVRVFRIIQKSEFFAKGEITKANKTYGSSPLKGSQNVKVQKGMFLGKEANVAIKGDYVIEHVMNLRHCLIDNVSVGNFDGTKLVTEDIQGVSRFFTFSQNVSGYYKKSMVVDEM